MKFRGRQSLTDLPVHGWQRQKSAFLDQIAHLGGAEVAHEPDLDVVLVGRGCALSLAFGQVDAAQEGVVGTPGLLRAHVVRRGLLDDLVVLATEWTDRTTM